MTKLDIDIEESYRTYGPMVYRRCLKLLKDEAWAMDAMQDVFVQLLKHEERMENQGMSSLLYRMATNVSLNWIRHQKVRDQYQQQQLQLPEDDYDDHTSLEQSMVVESELLKVAKRVPERTLEAAIYHYVDGYTMDEVGQMMAMSNSNVRRILREMRQSIASLEQGV